MTHITTRLAGRLGGLLVVGLLAFPAAVFANTGEPIAQTGGMSATLPLFGAALTVDVTLDKTTGNISGVVLTPTGGFTANTTTPELVKYANAAGTTTVSVRARGNSETIKARSGSLADFLGSGTWSADVFGTGSKSTVDYTIGTDGSGNPTLAFGTITLASGITDVVNAPTMHSGHDGASASGGVKFSLNGFDKRLTISVKVSDENHQASVKISLSGKDRQKVNSSLAALGGPRTWSAHLCDGTAVLVNYHVVDTAGVGSIAFDGATGAPATSKVSGGEDAVLRVTFDGTNVGVSIRLNAKDDGTFTLNVKGASGRCGGHNDGRSHDSSKKSDSNHEGNHQGDSSGGSASGDDRGDGH